MNKVYDPGMHTAEHILNQTMDRMFGCGRCFTAHVEKKKSKCDYRFHRDLTPDEVGEIEKRVNAVVDADLTVTEAYVGRQEAERSYNVERLPPESGDIRVVRVGDYDACLCIGPHVASTKMIGGFQITSTRFKEGVLRIIFRLQS